MPPAAALPSLILTQRELAALQQSHPEGAQNLLSSTDAETNLSAMQAAVEPEQRCERNLFLHSSALYVNMKDEQYRPALTTDEAIKLEQGMPASYPSPL